MITPSTQLPHHHISEWSHPPLNSHSITLVNDHTLHSSEWPHPPLNSHSSITLVNDHTQLPQHHISEWSHPPLNSHSITLVNGGSTMMTTNHDSHNHDNQPGEIYPTMLFELHSRFGISFHVFIAVAVMAMVCGHHGLWPSWYRPITASTQLPHGKGKVTCCIQNK